MCNHEVMLGYVGLTQVYYPDHRGSGPTDGATVQMIRAVVPKNAAELSPGRLSLQIYWHFNGLETASGGFKC